MTTGRTYLFALSVVILCHVVGGDLSKIWCGLEKCQFHHSYSVCVCTLLIFFRCYVTGSEREVSVHSTRSSSQRRTPVRMGAKRKRTLLEETQESSMSDYSVNSSSKGEIEVAEVDPEGQFVKLHNKSNQEVRRDISKKMHNFVPMLVLVIKAWWKLQFIFSHTV